MFEANRQYAFDITVLSNVLEKHYSKELNFRNHCYLRIAFDATVNNKWDTKVGKPYTKYASEAQLQDALALLKGYLLDKQLLLIDNEKSLAFRENYKQIEQIRSPKLF